MSKMSKIVNNERENKQSKKVENFMGGISYTLNPLNTLKIITTSSIFGEPAYYRSGLKEKSYSSQLNGILMKYEGEKTSDIMEDAIDKSLEYNFKETIDWAVTLRKDYYMRLNPQIIMVRASMHPNRIEFNKNNPGYFINVNEKVMSRLDEPATQLTYWLYKTGNKNGIPNILKKSWAKKYENANRYQLAKYKNAEVGMIDTMRICHPNPTKQEAISELMKTGTIKVDENDTTWERLISEGKSWTEIINTIELQHMALLRNLRNIFAEITDREVADKLLEKLIDGSINGKQFPFRYYTAKKVIEQSNVNFKSNILSALDECLDITSNAMPKLSGKTMCLSDNSGSAWGTFNSEYGSVTVADIANLSSVITARNSDEGYVGVFGDELTVMPICNNSGILLQHKMVGNEGKNVGYATEGGLWTFFKNSLSNKEHWDNIFIYSDMQAGYAELYGTEKHKKEYNEYSKDSYIDLVKIINEYRRTVNPRVNIYTVQVAGYNNVVLPEILPRTSVLSGWTGKELIYASKMNELWDEIENRNN